MSLTPTIHPYTIYGFIEETGIYANAALGVVTVTGDSVVVGNSANDALWAACNTSFQITSQLTLSLGLLINVFGSM